MFLARPNVAAASCRLMKRLEAASTISAPFFNFLAIESISRPRDEAIFKQALRGIKVQRFPDKIDWRK